MVTAAQSISKSIPTLQLSRLTSMGVRESLGNLDEFGRWRQTRGTERRKSRRKGEAG